MTDSITRLREIHVEALDPARLEPLIGRQRMDRFNEVAETARQALAGRRVLNISSTATGGGVAEMLQTLLAYVRGAGVDTRWLVIEGDLPFFTITKRIHNWLYGSAGDGGELGPAEREHYERVIRENADEVLAFTRPGDIALVHDPQPAGLMPQLAATGARVLWRCHVGTDDPSEWTQRAWEFLRPYLDAAEAHIVSRATFAPPWVPAGNVHTIRPSIDPFSAKNLPLDDDEVRAILGHAGLIASTGEVPRFKFPRRDGSLGTISRRADVTRSGASAPADAPLVVQVSRWDPMKDMAGVMAGFARHVDPSIGAHLVLAGPAVTGVADDPEASRIYIDCVERWRALPEQQRDRIHLACMPMDDPDEQAAIVNALQRHAAIVVQKSIAEGFGLTVVEAMWKSRPVIGSEVGGIADQIVHGESGLLVADPSDLAGFGAAVEALLRDPAEAARLGSNACERARAEFLGDRHLQQYGELFTRLA